MSQKMCEYKEDVVKLLESVETRMDWGTEYT